MRPTIVEIELYYLVEMLESRIPDKSDYMKMLMHYVKNKAPKKKKKKVAIQKQEATPHKGKI